MPGGVGGGNRKEPAYPILHKEGPSEVLARASPNGYRWAMEALFSRDYMLLWALGLGVALFYPVRQLIWVLYMRRAHRLGEPDEAEGLRLKKRATVTAVLLCFVFAVLYTGQLFGDRP